MVTFLTLIQVLVALVLILVVLLQSAKGTDLAGAFGGMGSQTAFGPRGTTSFLSKTTAVLAAVFMVTSLSLSVLSNRERHGSSVLSGEKAVPVAPQPQQPAGAPQGNPSGVNVTMPPGFKGPTPKVQVTQEPIPAPTPAPAAKAAPKQATPTPAQPPAPDVAPPAEPPTAAPPGQ